MYLLFLVDYLYTGKKTEYLRKQYVFNTTAELDKYTGKYVFNIDILWFGMYVWTIKYSSISFMWTNDAGSFKVYLFVQQDAHLTQVSHDAGFFEWYLLVQGVLQSLTFQ